MYLWLQVGREPHEQVVRRQQLEMRCSCQCPQSGKEEQMGLEGAGSQTG